MGKMENGIIELNSVVKVLLMDNLVISVSSSVFLF